MHEIILVLIYVMSRFSLSKFVTIGEYVSLISVPTITSLFKWNVTAADISHLSQTS